MGVTIRRSFGRLADLTLVDADDMTAAGRLLRERIIRRTHAGESSEGAAFAPYSAGYRKRKAAELGSATPVNLQVSGEMLRAIQIEATDRQVTLFFSR